MAALPTRCSKMRHGARGEDGKMIQIPVSGVRR